MSLQVKSTKVIVYVDKPQQDRTFWKEIVQAKYEPDQPDAEPERVVFSEVTLGDVMLRFRQIESALEGGVQPVAPKQVHSLRALIIGLTKSDLTALGSRVEALNPVNNPNGDRTITLSDHSVITFSTDQLEPLNLTFTLPTGLTVRFDA